MVVSGSFRRGPGPARMPTPSDEEIARRVTQRFEWSVQIPGDNIEVRVRDGWVTLTGLVDWRYQALAAESYVREMGGIRGITNLIRVAPRAHDADVKEQTMDLAWTWQHH